MLHLIMLPMQSNNVNLKFLLLSTVIKWLESSIIVLIGTHVFKNMFLNRMFPNCSSNRSACYSCIVCTAEN